MFIYKHFFSIQTGFWKFTLSLILLVIVVELKLRLLLWFFNWLPQVELGTLSLGTLSYIVICYKTIFFGSNAYLFFKIVLLLLHGTSFFLFRLMLFLILLFLVEHLRVSTLEVISIEFIFIPHSCSLLLFDWRLLTLKFFLLGYLFVWILFFKYSQLFIQLLII